MKASAIKVNQEYAYKAGQYGALLKVKVMETPYQGYVKVLKYLANGRDSVETCPTRRLIDTWFGFRARYPDRAKNYEERRQRRLDQLAEEKRQSEAQVSRVRYLRKIVGHSSEPLSKVLAELEHEAQSGYKPSAGLSLDAWEQLIQDLTGQAPAGKGGVVCASCESAPALPGDYLCQKCRFGG